MMKLNKLCFNIGQTLLNISLKIYSKYKTYLIMNLTSGATAEIKKM